MSLRQFHPKKFKELRGTIANDSRTDMWGITFFLPQRPRTIKYTNRASYTALPIFDVLLCFCPATLGRNGSGSSRWGGREAGI